MTFQGSGKWHGALVALVCGAMLCAPGLWMLVQVADETAFVLGPEC